MGDPRDGIQMWWEAQQRRRGGSGCETTLDVEHMTG